MASGAIVRINSTDQLVDGFIDKAQRVITPTEHCLALRTLGKISWCVSRQAVCRGFNGELVIQRFSFRPLFANDI